MEIKIWKLGIMAIFPLLLWFTPPPEGLTVEAWKLLGFYLAAILGLILRPFSEPLVLLTSMGFASIFLNNTSSLLTGYSTTTIWLVFAAFSISTAFVKTGLGKRIAYLMIRSFGSTTLRLGYVTAFLDFIISPVTPSNTARSGGIVFPIIHAIAKALGSDPGESAKRAGSYLMANVYFVMKVTSFMFITAMAPNLLTAEFMNRILGVDLNWGNWAVGLVVPGIILLLIFPLLGYYLDKPEIKYINNKKIAAEGLNELGSLKNSEKVLIVIFTLALLGWALPSIFGLIGLKLSINATAVALVAMVLSFLFGVITWNDMLANKGAWNTLIWFGGIIGMATALDKANVFDWLAQLLGDNINFGDNPFIILIIIGLLSIIVRYFFASASSYVVAMLPVFLTVGKVAGADPMALALLLAATNSFGGLLTHYGAGAAPIIFGAGYNSVVKWWGMGAIMALIAFIVFMTIGYGWWGLIGLIQP
ncbi:membrane protein [Chelonobacter oris]|uniref:Membrane protein n=1 Tax=Chelonobacter oris TaxID=505317 RepID=A0A0A3BBH1_9PAST|nr:DASS family sodium-coupled anion symporter [Chelonobacter oris]KGQ70899.1 membrane protein [Chelonobacter oris]